MLVISLYLAQKYPITDATLRGSEKKAATPFLIRYFSSCFSIRRFSP